MPGWAVDRHNDKLVASRLIPEHQLPGWLARRFFRWGAGERMGTDTLPAWAERWLRQYVESAPAADRESRAAVADGFRSGRYTLDDVVRGWVDERQFDAEHADHHARVLLALYRHTRGNALAVWRMFQVYRSAGLAVPEFVLQKLDRWAAALERASGKGPAEIARALGLTVRGGGASGRAALDKAYAKLDRLTTIQRLASAGLEPKDIDRLVARDHRCTIGAAKKARIELGTQVKSRAKRATHANIAAALSSGDRPKVRRPAR